MELAVGALVMFVATQLIAVGVKRLREARRPPPVAHVESGSSHLRRF